MHEYLLDFQFLAWFVYAFNNLARLTNDSRSESLTVLVYTDSLS